MLSLPVDSSSFKGKNIVYLTSSPDFRALKDPLGSVMGSYEMKGDTESKRKVRFSSVASRSLQVFKVKLIQIKLWQML